MTERFRINTHQEHSQKRGNNHKNPVEKITATCCFFVIYLKVVFLTEKEEPL